MKKEKYYYKKKLLTKLMFKLTRVLKPKRELIYFPVLDAHTEKCRNRKIESRNRKMESLI